MDRESRGFRIRVEIDRIRKIQDPDLTSEKNKVRIRPSNKSGPDLTLQKRKRDQDPIFIRYPDPVFFKYRIRIRYPGGRERGWAGLQETKLGAKNFQLDKTRCIHPVKKVKWQRKLSENIKAVKKRNIYFLEDQQTDKTGILDYGIKPDKTLQSYLQFEWHKWAVENLGRKFVKKEFKWIIER